MGSVGNLGPVAIRDDFGFSRFRRHNHCAFRFQQNGQPLGNDPVDMPLGQFAVAADCSLAGLRRVAGINADNKALQSQRVGPREAGTEEQEAEGNDAALHG